MNFHRLFALIWLAGLMMALAQICAAQIRLRQMSRKMKTCENLARLKILENLRRDFQIARPVKLLVSQISVSPMTWGIWRPVISLPSKSVRWPDERLRVVLSHELAHIKRRDCLAQELAQLACAFYWFNPLAWLAARRMRAERERACDDFVLNAGACPAEYANHLVEIARQFSTVQFGGAMAMARPSGLESRVTAILDERRKRNVIGKMTAAFVAVTIFGFGFLMAAYSAIGSQNSSPENLSVSAQLKSFVVKKEAQEKELLDLDKNDYFKEGDATNLPTPNTKTFFAAAEKGDWLAVSNSWSELEKRAWDTSINAATNKFPHGRWEQPVKEVFGATEMFVAGSKKYSQMFGDEVIQSIPAGSVYFGGTDPGRFVVTALQKSQPDGDPFFTLTQNALADKSYLDYLRSSYGEKIYIPTSEDQQKSFSDYVAAARIRSQNHQLKPGENYRDDKNGRVEVGGATAIMEINSLLAKIIFDKTPDREFYIEQSWPLDWTYPYLEPHGLIFKINRQPLDKLSDEMVQRDHKFWTQTIRPMIGDWLNEKTPVSEIVAFDKKIFLRHDLSGFTGDREFALNSYASRMFCKERVSSADLYVWRMNHAASDDEKTRMAREADFAFRQALALSPYNHKLLTAYAGFLKNQNRIADAALVNELAAQIPEKK